MKIIKCGGSSLKKFDDRKKIYDEIKKMNESVVVIVSAFNDSPYSTSSLQSLLKQNYTYEMLQELITIGEIISSIRVCNEMLNEYIDATLIYKEQIGIFVETSNKMDQITGYDGKYIKEAILAHKVVIIPGFIGINQNDRIVSLNENGSDLTAVLVAKMLNENDVYLYKDVLGLASINPSISRNYQLYKTINFDLMKQIVSHGSDILQYEAINFALKHQINIHIQHYLNHNYSSIITSKSNEKVVVFQIYNQDIFIDGYNNSSTIENILLEKNIKYDYILPCNNYLKIVTSYKNEKDIIIYLHQLYLKGVF